MDPCLWCGKSKWGHGLGWVDLLGQHLWEATPEFVLRGIDDPRD